MKRFFVLAIIVAIFASMAVASAEDLGVQVIGGNDSETEIVNLDDTKIGATYKIDGYAEVELVSYGFVDSFAQYEKDRAGDNSMNTFSNLYSKRTSQPGSCVDAADGVFTKMYWNDSGTTADFAWLVINITNLQKQEIAYIKEASVKVIFDDEYEYGGWVRQFNYDYNTEVFRASYEGVYAKTATLDPANEEPVGMLYTGNYAFGCTLPNAVVESKHPLRMVIMLGGNEITYNIRK